MLRHWAFLVLLLVSSLYAALRGGPPERAGAAALLLGAVLSVAVATPFSDRFRHLETGILVVDGALLSIFLWLSLHSERFWPIWVTGLLAAEIVVHVMHAIVPGTVPQAYMDAVALWSWAAQLILIVATWRHRSRLARRTAGRPWRR